MDINHISVSRKQLWDQCTQAYKYKYHLKLETPGPEKIFLTLGKTVHKIAEEYVIHQGEKLLAEIAYEVLEGKIPIERETETFAPKFSPEYQRRIGLHLRSIQKITSELGFGGHLEYPFNYDLDPPNNKFVKGFIDRLVQKGDFWFILDYKTTKKGQWRKDSKSVLHDLQLRTYARVVQKEFGVPAENIRCALYYLDDASLVGAKYTDQALISAEAELLEVYNQIVNTPPDQAQGNVGEHCKFCDWQKICPWYGSQRKKEFWET